MTGRWNWIATAVARAAHAEQLAEHGGAAGVRDAGALESAMMRPRNLADYGEPDIAALRLRHRAQRSVRGRQQAHRGGGRGNLPAAQRPALTASDAELVVAILALAAGELGEEELADWFREHIASG